MNTPSSSRIGLRCLALNLPHGGRVPLHAHNEDQLLHAAEGAMSVRTREGAWVVPPGRALWLPAGAAHHIDAPGFLALRTVYLPSGRVEGLPRRCLVVGVPPLLRELILHLVAPARPRPRGAEQAARRRRLERVLLDLIAELPQEPLALPEPRDPRVRRLADRLMAQPDDPRTLSDWARTIGASPRTLQRHLRAETGMGFERYRQQIRLHRALILLADGMPVGTVAHRVGYESPSAFVAMFKRALGTTPGRYFATSP